MAGDHLFADTGFTGYDDTQPARGNLFDELSDALDDRADTDQGVFIVDVHMNKVIGSKVPRPAGSGVVFKDERPTSNCLKDERRTSNCLKDERPTSNIQHPTSNENTF